jgi:hypothetical protein
MTDWNVCTKITSRRIADMFVGAIEGGSTYWCDGFFLKSGGAGNHRPWYDNPEVYDNPELDIEVMANDDGAITRVTQESIKKGLSVMTEKYPEHMADLIGETDDADTADVFLQCVSLGEVIYG